MINQLVVSSACCCLQFCCKEIFETAYKVIGRISFIKLVYSIIYFSFIACVYFVMYLLREWEYFMKVFAHGISCVTLTEEFDCISASVVYRITLSLFMFSLVMVLILTLATARIARILNQGLFFSKFVITIIFFIITLQFPNDFIEKYSFFAQIFSYIYIVWQVIIIVDLGYLWGIKWAAQYSQGKSYYSILLIGFTIINYVISIGLNTYGYILSRSNNSNVGSCGNYANIMSSIFIVMMFGIQLLNYNKQNSLLATSFISVFTSYWLLSSIFSEEACNNTLIISDQDTKIEKSTFLRINIPISLLFVLLSSYGSIQGSSNEEKLDNFIELQQNITLQKQLKPQQEQSLYKQKKMWIKFHIFMMAMSLYVCMVCTDWGSGDILNGKFQLTQNAQISKLFTASITFIIYQWTLLAPRLFPNRNFYFQ